MNRFEAKHIIECLRSGVSSRQLSAIFSYGREAALERVVRELGRVKGEGTSRCLVLKGNFGNGKTHFLNIVFQQAHELNMAVSLVALSKETPFNRIDALYRRVTAQTYLPGSAQPGFEPLLSTMKRGSENADKLLSYADRELHPKIGAVLRNYFEPNDPYNQHLLYSDLAGDFLPATQLKSIHRLNFGSALRVPRFTREYVFDYFRFLSYLFRLAGYAGWVILLDEFEQVMYLGVMARAQSYLNAARFMSPAYGLTATYTVFSASSNLWSELLWKERRSDYEVIPEKLAAKGLEHETPTVREVFGCFLRDNLFLDTLSSFDVRRMLEAIRQLHAQAYGWPAEVDFEPVVEGVGDKPLRTIIRAVVEYLDLQYLYGEEPEIHVGMPQEPIGSPPGDAGEEFLMDEPAAGLEE